MSNAVRDLRPKADSETPWLNHNPPLSGEMKYVGGYQGATTILEGKWRFQEHLSGGRGGGEELSPCDIFPRADSVPTAAFVLDVGRDKVHLGHDI